MRITKDCFVVLFFAMTLFWTKSALAIYDPLSVPNNKFGIHILDTSEVAKAAELVNSSGGVWGYVTIPIRANDRDLPKWITFMEKCRDHKVIPIVRIATFPDGDKWSAPNEYEILDMANFLNELPWPTKNRYVIVYNEPNHQGEWGGFVYPQEYARVLDRATDIFHKINEDFFVISAGMDSSQPTLDYFRQMELAWPGVLNRVDGLSFHSYGNPGFNSYPNAYSKVNITSYRFEQQYLCRYFAVCDKPIFLTEAGWRWDLVGDFAIGKYFKIAFENFWVEDNIVAVTPFLLDAQHGPFTGFSFVGSGGQWRPFVKEIIQLSKIPAIPNLANTKKQDVEAVTTTRGKNFQIDDIIFFKWIGKLQKILKIGSN